MKTLTSGGRTRTASVLDGDAKCGWGELKGTGGRMASVLEITPAGQCLWSFPDV